MDTDTAVRPEEPPVHMPRSVDRTAKNRGNSRPSVAEGDHDFFVEKDGERLAGIHLLLDMWNARNLENPQKIELAFRAAAKAAGATVLSVFHHSFSPSGGISCIAALAESHISVHTWPERDFAAIDIFMCGTCDPYLAASTLRRFFAPSSVEMTEQKRGLLR
jgi:S-adenosylmethionine decarboxylase